MNTSLNFFFANVEDKIKGNKIAINTSKLLPTKTHFPDPTSHCFNLHIKIKISKVLSKQIIKNYFFP